LEANQIMRDCLATRMLSIVMMLLTPAAMLVAETGNTMLYASGKVTLNGTEVARSASVTPGDKIETAGATATMVSQDGSKVTVNPYSAIRYESADVNVVRGTAAINTTDGMPAQAAQISIAPKDKAASYEIARLNNQVVIISHTGALMITEGGTTSELEPGSSSSRAADPSPAPAPAPQAAPVFPGSELSARSVIYIGAIVGGAAVACGLECGMSASSVAPTNMSVTAAHQNHAIPGHGSVAHAIAGHGFRAATVALARPVLAGVSNSARINAARHGAQQHHSAHGR
jgi:hypothetical protein